VTAQAHLESALPAEPVHLTIHGRVQGVGFRDAFCVQASRLGLEGWVRNRRDGSVEAVVGGDPHALQALVRWANRGPPAAQVERLVTRPAAPAEVPTLQGGFRRLPSA